MGKSIGFFGGTFDPIHCGHLNLAIEILEARQLDEVWFCPAYISPHKLEISPTSVEHRLKMLSLAIEGEPRFKILDTEIKRLSPSFTIDTIQELLATQLGKSDPHRFSLILGEDAFPGFFHWRQPEEIVRLVPLLIGSRSGFFPTEELKGDPRIIESIENGITPTRVMEISSTDIRDRISRRLYCRHLMPAKVLDYIYAHDLYSSI